MHLTLWILLTIQVVAISNTALYTYINVHIGDLSLKLKIAFIPFKSVDVTSFST